jgi:hypothetical protein
MQQQNHEARTVDCGGLYVLKAVSNIRKHSVSTVGTLQYSDTVNNELIVLSRLF